LAENSDLRAKVEELTRLASQKRMEADNAKTRSDLIEARFDGVRRKAEVNAEKVFALEGMNKELRAQLMKL
jgi:hypothetical protein